MKFLFCALVLSFLFDMTAIPGLIGIGKLLLLISIISWFSKSSK